VGDVSRRLVGDGLNLPKRSSVAGATDAVAASLLHLVVHILLRSVLTTYTARFDANETVEFRRPRRSTPTSQIDK
jgi:hypothetical protein